MKFQPDKIKCPIAEIFKNAMQTLFVNDSCAVYWNSAKESWFSWFVLYASPEEETIGGTKVVEGILSIFGLKWPISCLRSCA